MTTYQTQSGWVPDTQAFGARLALIRHEMRWNLKEAALACGLPQGSWREWELKGRDPRGIQEVVARICHGTGVDEYWLLTGKGDPHGPFTGNRSTPPSGDVVVPAQPTELVVISNDDAVAEDASRYVAMAEDTSPPTSATLRLTAECSAKLSYRGRTGRATTLPHHPDVAA